MGNRHMLYAIKKAWMGRGIWRRLRKKYGINYDMAVIALNSEDEEWNRLALLHLPDYMERKKAKKAMVFYTEAVKERWLDKYNNVRAEWVFLEKGQMQLLADYYCFYRFFDSIAFCFKADNHAEMILDRGAISKEELICLGFFHLRSVPPIRKEGMHV